MTAKQKANNLENIWGDFRYEGVSPWGRDGDNLWWVASDKRTLENLRNQLLVRMIPLGVRVESFGHGIEPFGSAFRLIITPHDD